MVLTDWWVRESDLGSSFKGYMGYKEVLGGKDDIGGPNQANPEALAFILWCPKAISEWFENPVNLGLINELGFFRQNIGMFNWLCTQTYSIIPIQKQALLSDCNQLNIIMLQTRSRTRPCNVAQNGGSTSVCTSTGIERESCNNNQCREFQPLL